MIIADSLGFLGVPGGPVEINPELNLNLVHLTAAKPLPWGSDSMADVRREIRDFKYQLSASGRVYPFLEDGSELDSIVELIGKTVTIFGLQHTPKDANPAELRTLGIRFVVLSYSGYLEDDNRTLTDKERNFILDCDKYGIGIDLSHTGSEKAKSILDFLKIAEVKIPAIASHTACYGQYPHKRNLSDEVLRQIAEHGGIIGISAIAFFLDNKDKSLNPMKSHIHRAMYLCGVDSVCIGSDIPYLRRELDQWEEHFSLMKSKLDPKGKLGAVWPDYPVELNTANKEAVFTEMVSSLCDNKEKEQEIVSKILGVNFYKFVKKYL